MSVIAMIALIIVSLPSLNGSFPLIDVSLIMRGDTVSQFHVSLGHNHGLGQVFRMFDFMDIPFFLAVQKSVPVFVHVIVRAFGWPVISPPPCFCILHM